MSDANDRILLSVTSSMYNDVLVRLDLSISSFI